MRYEKNPIITPKDVIPTRDDFEIICVFNAGAVRFKDEIILLLRVAERPIAQDGYVSTTVLDLDKENSEYKILNFKKGDPNLDISDPRGIIYKKKSYLTSISHLRIARSKDGFNFEIDKEPFIRALGIHEEFGVEDPRITFIDGQFLIDYTSVSRLGIGTSLISTKDFKSYERMGVIFPPMNRDVAIFPEKIDGKYVALHRPYTAPFAKPSMWLAYSEDLIKWGEHKLLMTPDENSWDSIRIGAGAPPIKTDKGWLEIYHGVSDDETYSLGVLLLDLDDPSKILFRSKTPFLTPQEHYEKIGFVKNIIFSNGMVCLSERDNQIIIYYGAADKYLCAAQYALDEILKQCS